MSTQIVLVGCGNMGFAMLKGWLEKDPSLDVQIVEPITELRQRAEKTGAGAFASIKDLPEDLMPDLVVIAVKPDKVADVLAQSEKLAKSGASFVSVAAGITLKAMQAALAHPAPLIRCMPNTPAAIGEGMLVVCPGKTVSDQVLKLTERLFSASGAVAWIDDESLMDAVTAISGSGPAYIFHFIETLTEAGIKLGLPEPTALLLARQTVSGAGRYAQISDVSPTILREQVTSPGGTTEAALEILMEKDGLTQLLQRATQAASDRSRELGQK